MRKKYKQVEDKLVYDITYKGDRQQFLVPKEDKLELEVEDSNLWFKGSDGSWYLTDNNACDYISHGWIEEIL